MDLYREKKFNFFSTVSDVKTEIGYDTYLLRVTIEDEDQIMQCAQSILTYAQTTGQAFLDKYSYLPNIFKEIKRLESENILSYELLYSSGPEWRWRDLIISKLCNDKDFDSKLALCDEVFYNTPIIIQNGWLPYHEKFKERLALVVPKYNI